MLMKFIFTLFFLQTIFLGNITVFVRLQRNPPFRIFHYIIYNERCHFFFFALQWTVAHRHGYMQAQSLHMGKRHLARRTR